MRQAKFSEFSSGQITRTVTDEMLCKAEGNKGSFFHLPILGC